MGLSAGCTALSAGQFCLLLSLFPRLLRVHLSGVDGQINTESWIFISPLSGVVVYLFWILQMQCLCS